MGRVQNPEAIFLRRYRKLGVGGAVDYRGIQESLRAPGRVGRSGPLRRLTEKAIACIRHTVNAFKILICHRPIGNIGGGRPEPRAIMPPAIGIYPAQIGIEWVLGRHVHMGPPEVSGYGGGADSRPLIRPRGKGIINGSRITSPYPGRIRVEDVCRICGIAIHIGLVLNDQGNLLAGNRPGNFQISNKSILGSISDQQTRGAADINIQAGDAPAMIVVKHHP